MMSLPLGIVAVIIVLILSAAGVDVSNYLNSHAFVIVIGGTAAVLLISTPNSVIVALYHNIISLFKQRRTMTEMKSELMRLAENRGSVTTSKDPLIAYAIALWERGEDSHSFQALISQYRDKLEMDENESVAALQNLSKYPPALGMMGTVMGMISLFANLGSSNKDALGPALGVAMTATFYGLVIANAILLPLADRISVESIYRKKYYGFVYEILTMVNRREPSNKISEEIQNREAA